MEVDTLRTRLEEYAQALIEQRKQGALFDLLNAASDGEVAQVRGPRLRVVLRRQRGAASVR